MKLMTMVEKNFEQTVISRRQIVIKKSFSFFFRSARTNTNFFVHSYLLIIIIFFCAKSRVPLEQIINKTKNDSVVEVKKKRENKQNHCEWASCQQNKSFFFLLVADLLWCDVMRCVKSFARKFHTFVSPPYMKYNHFVWCAIVLLALFSAIALQECGRNALK